VLPALLLAAAAPVGDGLDAMREQILFEPVYQTEMRVYEAGPEQAPAVVLVHGIGDAGARDWLPVVPALAARFRVIMPDLPGFGRSEKPNTQYTTEGYATVLKYLADALAIPGPFALAGHSMGGMVALRYAATWPRDVRRLVLADVAGILSREAFARAMAGPYGDMPGIRGIFRGSVGLPGGFDEEEIVGSPRLRTRILKANPSAIVAITILLDDFTRLIPRVAAPTLVAWGVRDQVAPPRTGRLLAARLPDARLETLDAAHVPMDDAPEAFGALLVREFGSPPPPAPEPPAPLNSDRFGRCADRRDPVSFRGDYDRIEISGCPLVVLDHVRARSVDIRNSTVQMDTSELAGDLPLNIVHSRLEATGCRVEGRVAIRLSDSRLDLAGVDIVGGEAAVRSEDRASIVFSVSNVRSPHGSGPRHGPVQIAPDRPL